MKHRFIEIKVKPSKKKRISEKAWETIQLYVNWINHYFVFQCAMSLVRGCLSCVNINWRQDGDDTDAHTFLRLIQLITTNYMHKLLKTRTGEEEEVQKRRNTHTCELCKEIRAVPWMKGSIDEKKRKNKKKKKMTNKRRESETTLCF